jgi:hypothetical protein
MDFLSLVQSVSAVCATKSQDLTRSLTVQKFSTTFRCGWLFELFVEASILA